MVYFPLARTSTCLLDRPQRTHPHSNCELSIGTTLVKEGDTVVLSKLYCRDASLMGYLWCLIFSAAEHNFWFSAKHIPGCLNILTNSILHNKVDLFLSQAPPQWWASCQRSCQWKPPSFFACRTWTGSPWPGGGCSAVLFGEFSHLDEEGLQCWTETFSRVLNSILNR